MDLYIDGIRLPDDSVVENGTIEDAVREVQQSRCRPGRLVVGLRCNGVDVPAEAMTETLKRPAAGLSRLDLVTSTKGRLVSEAMDHAAESLDEVETSAEQVASMLIEGRTADALKGLGECTRTWQQIHEAVVQSIELLELDPDTTPVGEGTLMQAMTQPGAVLTQVRDALQAQDHVLLADLLQYELADAIQDWRGAIARVRSLSSQNAEDDTA